LAVGSGGLLALAFPSPSLAAVAWVGLVPLLVALRLATPRGAAGLGFLFGCILVGGTFRWVNSIDVIERPAFALMVVCSALYYLAFGPLYRWTSQSLGPWTLAAAPVLWVGIEYVRANLSFVAMPWNLLGHSQYRLLPVIQIADLTGAYGVSFLVVMVNELLTQRVVPLGKAGPGPSRPSFAAVLAVAGCLAVSLGYGYVRLSETEAAERLRVAIVQANRVPGNGMSPIDQRTHLQAYEALTREAARSRPELIVWPASSLPAPMSSSLLVQFTLKRLADETKAYLLVGGAGGQKFAQPQPGQLPYSNSEFLLSPAGRVVGQYNKIRLTPFNEYVPLRAVIPWPRWITPVRDSYIAGDAQTLFELPSAKFASPVCWENNFSDFFRRFVRDGASFMVSVTNEAFFGMTGAPYQTLASTVFRAVENRVTVVRAATTGVSAFISARGEIDRVRDDQGRDLFVAGVLIRDVPISHHRTFYTLYGDVFGRAALAASIVIAGACLASGVGVLPVGGPDAIKRQLRSLARLRAR
jgi:apolipoprotein N-acyltransferase